MVKTAKRLLFYIGGFFILAIGINISKTAALGISPVSAIPYAAELIWGIELGKATLLVYVGLILLQIVLLRKDYKVIQLLQIVCTYILSFFITYTSTKYLLIWLPIPSNYAFKLIYLLISIVVIGIGVSFYLVANYIPLPAEGLCNAIVKVSKDKFKFGNVKIGVDISLVTISAILSLVFLGGLQSVREGTIIAAILVGKVVGFILKRYKAPINAWFDKGEIKKEEVITPTNQL
jgi:uncharacterized membrane protein YczE